MDRYTVILTHAGADLDAISSMYAAGKLYPGSFLIHPGSLDVSARKLTSFFGDTLNFIKMRELPSRIKNNIHRIIIVDTKILARVGEGRELIKENGAEIIIFDHHPPSVNDIKNAKIVHKDVGANTTILVNLLKKKKITLNPFEATLLALGIYEDTGSFMFPGVTREDFEAVAFLSVFGINMQIVRHFVSPFLTKAQMNLLKTLLSHIEETAINGIQVAITTASMDKYVQGISVVTHRLREILDSDFLFVIIQTKDGVFIMGRSNAPEYNVKDILLPIGGGEHYNAATAFVKNGNVEALKNFILSRIKQSNFHTLKARSIMSYPVKTVDAKTGIKEALKTMIKMGFSGLPVTENNKIIGIISKRDIEKIMLIEKRNRPVKQYISPKIFTVSPEEDLRKIEAIMATNNVGRVLVKENGKIVGIISRSDLLKAYFLKRNWRMTGLTGQEHTLLPAPEEVEALIKNHFPEKLISLLRTIGDIAKKTDQKVYLVGGAVRDLFLGANSLDFDFVLTKDAFTFGKLLEKEIKQKVKIYPQFNTAHTVYGNYKLDFVTARREYYEKNSVLPIVENASLKEDLGRRDFTINAIAVSLMPKEFGKIIDFYNGFSDLRKGVIRTLNTLSFIEDPSRLLRAIKYEVKLNFTLAPETEQLFKQAIKLGVLNNKHSSRITDELLELISEKYAPKAIEKLEKRNLLYPFFGIKRLSKIKKEAIKEAESIIKQFNAERLTVYLIILMHGRKREQIIEKLRMLNLNKKDINIIVNTTRLVRKIKTLLRKNDVFELFIIAKGLKKESAAGILSLLREPLSNKFAEIINKAYNTKLDITGDDLKKLGLKEGKQYRQILDKLAFLKAEGEITTKKDAITYIIRNKEKFDWNE